MWTPGYERGLPSLIIKNILMRKTASILPYPANFKAVYNRGKLRLKIDNTEGAIADLDKATSLKPEHAGAHELFGDALIKAGKEGEAALQWRIAEELRKKKS
jgi:Flp pilus assembly protein TadD